MMVEYEFTKDNIPTEFNVDDPLAGINEEIRKLTMETYKLSSDEELKLFFTTEFGEIKHYLFIADALSQKDEILNYVRSNYLFNYKEYIVDKSNKEVVDLCNRLGVSTVPALVVEQGNKIDVYETMQNIKKYLK